MSQFTRCSTVLVVTGARMELELQLTDDQWGQISDLFENPDPNPEGGRPRCDSRLCVEGILWVLRTGARWRDMPVVFPSGATCWRRLKEWTEDGIWDKAWSRLLRKLDRDGSVDRDESMADATFASAKKGVKTLARQSPEKEPKPWFSSTAMAYHWDVPSQQPAETTYV